MVGKAVPEVDAASLHLSRNSFCSAVNMLKCSQKEGSLLCQFFQFSFAPNFNRFDLHQTRLTQVFRRRSTQRGLGGSVQLDGAGRPANFMQSVGHWKSVFLRIVLPDTVLRHL